MLLSNSLVDYDPQLVEDMKSLPLLKKYLEKIIDLHFMNAKGDVVVEKEIEFDGLISRYSVPPDVTLKEVNYILIKTCSNPDGTSNTECTYVLKRDKVQFQTGRI